MFEKVYGVMMAIEQMDVDINDKPSVVVEGKYKITEIAKQYRHWSTSIGHDKKTLSVSDKLATLYFEDEKVTVHFSRGEKATKLINSMGQDRYWASDIIYW